MAETVAEINFFDTDTNDCPYHAYGKLRDDAPVWQDPVTGMWTLTPLRGHSRGSARHQAIHEPDRQRRRLDREGRPARGSGEGPPAARRGCRRGEDPEVVRGERVAGPPDPRRARRARAHAAAPSVRLRVPPGPDPGARSVRRGALEQAVRRVRRQGSLRVGQRVRDSPAALRDRPPDGRPRRGHAADQEVDGRVDPADGPDADPGGAHLVSRAGDRGAALLPGTVRGAPPAAQRLAAERSGQQPGEGMGPDAHRQRACTPR